VFLICEICVICGQVVFLETCTLSEFSLIQRYFTRPTPGAVLGVGDDAALVQVASGMELAISTDMLVSGTHFFPDTDPFMLGHKTLAVNLSDMAAMGAQPRWATLALSLPTEDESWLEKFSAGFFALADQFKVELIGGDTTRGPLNLCVTIMGEVPQGKALRRDGARVGDEIWVSGVLGEAALALAHMQGKVPLSEENFRVASQALHLPQPRVELGLALRGLATSAIDISDGLLVDLGHILERSKAGAQIQYGALPVSVRLTIYVSQKFGQRCVLAGGDDYELCFTAPVENHAELEKLSARMNLPLTCIGNICAGSGCKVYEEDGSEMTIVETGYEHFK
jgi:thiamine-monophosphate kinase